MSSGPSTEHSRTFRFDEFELFATQGFLLKGGARVLLTPKPLATLVLLVERAGETVSKDELLERVSGKALRSRRTISPRVFRLCGKRWARNAATTGTFSPIRGRGTVLLPLYRRRP